jgi:sacsin
LIVINDASFSQDDWNNIQQIGESGKALDTTKTGRFGLGFNSVYNVTDFPMLLTGSRIGIFDPHGHTVHGASSGGHGAAWRLNSALWSQCPDLLAPFKNFGLSSQSSEFPGTVFRLPLRTSEQAAKSDICHQPFTLQDFDSIVEKLRDHLSDLLVFLRNLQNIDISYVDATGNTRLLLAARTINREAVDHARSRIRQALATDHKSLLDALSGPNAVPVISEFEHEIDFTDSDGSHRRKTYLVVSGLFCDAKGQISECARQMLMLNEKAVPLAGAATRLDAPSLEQFQGRLFCGLPLPLASPLQFCHVNGFFDLQADRQGLFQDPGAGGTSAFRVNWNRLLLEHCCSEAAARLCTSVSRRAHEKAQSPYEYWPRIPAQEQSMLDALPRQTYQHLGAYECIPAGGGSSWSLPKNLVVLPSTASENLRVALLSDVFRLPNPPLPDFVSAGFAAARSPLTSLSPAALRPLLRVPVDIKCQITAAPRPCLKDATWICALLEFCASDSTDELLGIPLAYMSDGTLRAFGLNPGAPVFLAGEEERAILTKVTHWFIDSSLEKLGVLKESKRAGISRFTPQHAVVNLGKVLPNPGPEGRIRAGSVVENMPSESWLSEVFEYMTSHADELKLDNDLLAKFPMVPDQFGSLHVMGRAETPLLPGTEDSKALLTAVGDFGVPLVSGGEKLLKAVRGFVGAFPDIGVWRLSPRDLIDTLSAIAPQDPSLTKAVPMKAAAAILDYLSSARVVRDLKGPIADRVTKLRSLLLFRTSSGQIVSLDAGDHYIPADYALPEFATEVGLLDCGQNQRWLPLYQALNVPMLTRTRLLTKIVLPRVADLKDADIHRILLWLRTHLHAIREEETKETADALLASLRDKLPIHCTDGQLRPPGLLYHPDSKFAASLLGGAVGFPDLSIYYERSDLWLEFFEALGMARALRPNDIINAIDQVIASNQSDEEKALQVTEIGEYVDQHWDELKEQVIVDDSLKPDKNAQWYLSDALSHRRWLPAIRSIPREYPSQLLAALTSSFFRPSEMLARGALYLAGSVRPICRIARLSRVQDDIGLQTEPALDDVLTHYENTLSAAATTEGPVSERLAAIFNRIYDFLGRQFEGEQLDTLEADPRARAIRQRFALKPCLMDENRHFWLAEHCFADPVSNFLGRRVRIRAAAENVDRGLQILGRRDRPRAPDYVAFFSELITAHGHAPVPEVDRNLLRSAYQAAALLGDEDSFRGCPILLETGELVEASVAVLDDAPWLSERARSAGLLFLDPKLGEPVAITFAVRLLSSAVYERPEKEHPSRNSKFLAECSQLQAKLRSPQLYAGVYRLLKASDAVVRETDLQHFFEDLNVISVSQLSTTLVWMDGNAPVEGSGGPCDVVFDPFRNAVVVSEDADDVLYERIGSVLGNELRHDDHDLGEFAGYFVAILRVAPDAIDRHLTKLRVRALRLSSEEKMDSISDDVGGFIDDTEEPRQCETDAFDGSSDSVSDHTSQASIEENPIHAIPHESPGPAIHAGIGEDGKRASVSHSDSAVHDEIAVPTSDTVEQKAIQDSPASAEKPTHSDLPSTPERKSGVSERINHDTDQSHPSDTLSEEPGPAFVPDAGVGTTGKSRSDQTSTQRGRARTYVTPRSDGRSDESPDRQMRRQRVDQAAIQRVLKFERERDRHPKEMSHSNKGYDIESYLPNGDLDRFIEVKGLSGPWTEFGVAVSCDQFRKALKEGPAFWLYVVEFALEPARARVYAIQAPADLVDEYWFDNGWRDLSRERGVSAIGAALNKGTIVLVDGARRGTVTSIRKLGVLMQLDIDFEDNTRDQVVYSQRRVQVLQAAAEAETQP